MFILGKVKKKFGGGVDLDAKHRIERYVEAMVMHKISSHLGYWKAIQVCCINLVRKPDKSGH